VPVHCNWCSERFEGLLDGTLLPGERGRVLAHVAGCADCRSLLEELRVVDGLLLGAGRVTLTPDFTHATMDELRAQPAPQRCRAPVAAYVVCYLVAAWSLIAAAGVLSPTVLRAVGTFFLASGRTLIYALTGIAHAIVPAADRSDGSPWPTLAGFVVVVDVVLAIVFARIARRARLAIGERLRW
jgi:anti-sigma factor RsiW